MSVKVCVLKTKYLHFEQQKSKQINIQQHFFCIQAWLCVKKSKDAHGQSGGLDDCCGLLQGPPCWSTAVLAALLLGAFAAFLLLQRGGRSAECALGGRGPVCHGQSLVCASLLVGTCRQQVSSLSGYQQCLCGCAHSGKIKNKQWLGNSKLIEKESCPLRAFSSSCEYLFPRCLSEG